MGAVLYSEAGSRLLASLGRAGKTLDGLLDLRPLLHPWEIRALTKLTGGAKERISGVPSCMVLCPFLLGTPRISLLGAVGAARCIFAPWGAVSMPGTAFSWLARLHLRCRVRGSPSPALLRPALFKWEKIRAVVPITSTIDSIMLNDNCKKAASIIKKGPLTARHGGFLRDLHLLAEDALVLPAAGSLAVGESIQLRDGERDGFPSPIPWCLGSRA